MRSQNVRESFAFSRTPGLSGALGGLAVILALGGCAVGPKFQPPEVTTMVDSTWSVKEQPGLTTVSAPDTTWWRSFNDPALDSLVEIAYRQNLPLQVAGLRILEARAQLGIAAGRKWPQVQVAFGNATAVGLSDNAPYSFGLDRNFWDYQVGFDAAWETDFWGKYGQEVKAEHYNVLTSMADYDNALCRSRQVAHLRDHPHLRGAHRPGAAERHGATGRTADRPVALPQRCHLRARRLPGDHAAGEHQATIRSSRPPASRPRTLCAP